MMFPDSITINDSAAACDGGTIVLFAVSDVGAPHEILLAQHAHREDEFARWNPGRLYFDQDLIDLRSAEESAVIPLLKHAKIDYTGTLPKDEPIASIDDLKNWYFDEKEIDKIKAHMNRTPEEDLRATCDEMIQYIESDEYLEFASSGPS